jgi:hypothetical protein
MKIVNWKINYVRPWDQHITVGRDVVKQMRDEIKQYQTRVWIDNTLKVKI